MPKDPKVTCPSCGKKVDRVDGEYARHYPGGALCVTSKREIPETGKRGILPATR